jgi:hypothetical protein
MKVQGKNLGPVTQETATVICHRNIVTGTYWRSVTGGPVPRCRRLGQFYSVVETADPTTIVPIYIWHGVLSILQSRIFLNAQRYLLY